MSRWRYDYEVHPLAKLFPLMPENEFKQLKSDIAKNGQVEPIIVDHSGKILLDGRNRLKACKELGIEPRVERYMGRPGTEREFIWSKNVLRRHLSDDQRAMLSQRWAAAEKEAAKQRQREHGGTAPGRRRKRNTSGESAQSVRARSALAKKARVSEHKIRQAEMVAAKAPQLAPKVESGEMPLSVAVTVAKPPKPKEITVCVETCSPESLLITPREAVDRLTLSFDIELPRIKRDVAEKDHKEFDRLVADFLISRATKLRPQDAPLGGRSIQM